MSEWDDFEDESELEEEAIDPELDGWERGVAVPIMRATYAQGLLTVVVPRQRLLNDGDITGMSFDARSDAGVSIIELGETELDGFGWELTVGFLAEGNRARAERAIQIWSARVGYRRVWFPDRIYEPGRPPRPHTVAMMDCPTCGHPWRGRGRRFWRQVWDVRLFPNLCPLCGGTLPQWRLVPRRGPAAERRPRRPARGRMERLAKRLEGREGFGTTSAEESARPEDLSGPAPPEDS